MGYLVPGNSRDFDDGFYGSRKEGSSEITTEELRDSVIRLTSLIYEGRLRDVAEIVAFLRSTKTKVNLYHRVDEDRAWSYVDGVALDQTGEEGIATINASHVAGQYYGQGLYWGIDKPYRWVFESDFGACYIMRDVPLENVLPVQCAGQMMALMPVSRLQCKVTVDDTSKASFSNYFSEVEDQCIGFQRRLMYRDGLPNTKPIYDTQSGYWHHNGDDDRYKGLYLDVVKNSSKEKSFSSWWKAQIGLQVLATQNIPDQKTLREVDRLLGIDLVEEVLEDPEMDCPYYRVYVREKTPMLCMSIAAAARLPELVFGDNPGIHQMKQQAIDEHRVVMFR